MVTMNIDLIAQMSCNPAIGGIAKGHLVREIDALGGIMGELTDSVGIQFRLLNTSRGPAVWSPRAQCDKKQYRIRMREWLENEPNLRILQAEVAGLILGDEAGGRICRGVRLRDGRELAAESVVVTTGTFLNGLAHVGETRYGCGRSGEAASTQLGDQLRTLDLQCTRDAKTARLTLDDPDERRRMHARVQMRRARLTRQMPMSVARTSRW